MPRILVVDDEQNIRETLFSVFREAGNEVVQAGDGDKALELLRQDAFDLVLTDLRMPGADGLAVLAEAKKLNPRCAVLVMTAHASIDNAVEAMKRGADDYLTKPFPSGLEEVEVRVNKLLDKVRLAEERELFRLQAQPRGDLIGASPAFLQVKRQIAQVGPTATNVLILGETGSGKEGAARALHAASPRAEAPFVAANCAAFSPGLVESELFGHEKGAFTGANAARKGRLELAHGGTLFLDEVGDLPLETQVKLLRALEQKAFERVGGTSTLKADFRLVAATHRDLQARVREGKFREDLYFRLAVFMLHLPPLRERGEDIVLLAEHFLKEKAPGRGLAIAPWGRETLLAYEWPGNVRELQNVVERAALLSEGEWLRLDLALSDRAGRVEGGNGGSLTSRLREAEKRLIQDAMRRFEGNQTQAAKDLGIERSTLQYKLKKHGIG